MMGGATDVKSDTMKCGLLVTGTKSEATYIVGTTERRGMSAEHCGAIVGICIGTGGRGALAVDLSG